MVFTYGPWQTKQLAHGVADIRNPPLILGGLLRNRCKHSKERGSDVWGTFLKLTLGPEDDLEGHASTTDGRYQSRGQELLNSTSLDSRRRGPKLRPLENSGPDSKSYNSQVAQLPGTKKTVSFLPEEVQNRI